MKKNKHILINIDEKLYNKLVYIAEIEKRNITNAAYLLLSAEIEKKYLSLIDLNKSDLEKLTF